MTRALARITYVNRRSGAATIEVVPGAMCEHRLVQLHGRRQPCSAHRTDTGEEVGGVVKDEFTGRWIWWLGDGWWDR